MNIEDMTREEVIAYINLDADEIITHFTRETLLSALGFDRPSDYLDEVTIADARAFYSEDELLEDIDLADHWDSDDAYARYGSDLLDYFDLSDRGYSYTEDWTASDFIEGYGDNEHMLAVLLSIMKDLRVLPIVKANLSKETLRKLVDNSSHASLNMLLKAQRESLGFVKDFQGHQQ